MVKSKEFSSICPSIDRYNFHAYSGGGKVIMANALHKGRIEFTEEMLDVLYRCTNCGACEVVCKFFFELEPNEIIHELRVAAVEAGVGCKSGVNPQCAQYCVHHCCQILGVPVSLRQVCELLPPKDKGESILEMGNALERLGLRYSAEKVSFEELLGGSFPIIEHVNIERNDKHNSRR